jgi:hypothetical protein
MKRMVDVNLVFLMAAYPVMDYTDFICLLIADFQTEFSLDGFAIMSGLGKPLVLHASYAWTQIRDCITSRSSRNACLKRLP